MSSLLKSAKSYFHRISANSALGRRSRDYLRRIIDRSQYRVLSGTTLIGNGPGAWYMHTPSIRANQDCPILFSGGAGLGISFEIAFAQEFHGKVHLYDPSPTGKHTAEKHSTVAGIQFMPWALAKHAGTVRMSKPENPQEGSWTLPDGGTSLVDEFRSVSLVEEIKSKGYTAVDVIKLDIEGFEYEVIDSLLNSDVKIGQILLEYHHFFAHINVNQTKSAKKILKNKGYICYHKRGQDYCYVHSSKILQGIT